MYFRKLALALVMSASALGLSAAAPADAKVMVSLRDGSQSVYQFDESVKITFVDLELHLSTAAVDVSIPLADLDKVEYINVAAIEALPSTSTRIRVSQTDHEIAIAGAPTEASVTAYSVAGVMMARTAAAPDGTATIDTSAWTPGVYILTVGSQSFKLLTR